MNTPVDRLCPQCKRGDVVERRNKRTGQPFYGCSRYPDCKFAVAELAGLAPAVLAQPPADAPSIVTQGAADLVSAVQELTLAIANLAKIVATARSNESRDQSGVESI